MLSRRSFNVFAAGSTLGLTATTTAQQVGQPATTIRPRTTTLEIACEAWGPEAGPAVILLHGFPDDTRAWDGVAPPLAEAGCRIYVPFLRGFGATRFLSAETPRSGQQAAVGHDLLWMRSASRARCSSVTTGADGGHVSSLRFGPNVRPPSSRGLATTSKIS